MWKGNRVLNFRLSDRLMQSSISEAYLHVHIMDRGTRTNYTEEDDDELVTVSVQVTRVWREDLSLGAAAAGSASAGLSKAQRRAGHWLRLDITSSFNEWLELPRTLLGLVVRAYDSSRRRYVVPPTGTDSSDKQPYIEIHVDDDYRRRAKRTVGLTCNDDSRETRCCRYPLIVDFEEFGWDWIIAPKKYEANYCMGDCPYAFMQKYPNTHVVHLAAPPGYRGPCCTPRKVSPISLLHFDHELNIILGSLPAMVVEKCGCT